MGRHLRAITIINLRLLAGCGALYNHSQGLAGRPGRHDQLRPDWRANMEQPGPETAINQAKVMAETPGQRSLPDLHKPLSHACRK
jgi:hypothetical protein